MRILILGGTAEARELAPVLLEAGHAVTTSLAGRTPRPLLPMGAVRVGGFGGEKGLICYLETERIQAVVNATHPFAAQMSEHAAAACARLGIALLRWQRPSWATHPDADTWRWVDSHAEAALCAAGFSGPVLLTIGRQHVAAYQPALKLREVVCRVVVAPEGPLPDRWRLIEAQGPFTAEGERELLERLGTRVLVTKDSGGGLTAAKLSAARELGVLVVMVRRPPAAGSAVRSAEEVLAALAGALDRQVSAPGFPRRPLQSR